MSTSQKRFRISNLKLSEISSVDHPAQAGAVAVLIKRADGDAVAIRKDAGSVAAGSEPAFALIDYEDAMLDRAAELAVYHRITPEQALSKHLTTDLELRDLAFACEVARCKDYGNQVRTRHQLITTPQ